MDLTVVDFELEQVIRRSGWRFVVAATKHVD